jgi:hypothetical protein
MLEWRFPRYRCHHTLWVSVRIALFPVVMKYRSSASRLLTWFGHAGASGRYRRYIFVCNAFAYFRPFFRRIRQALHVTSPLKGDVTM